MRSQGHRLAGARRETSNTLPSATLVNGDRQQAVQVIERTGKRWKGIRVLGLFLIVVAGFVLFAQWAADDSRGVAAGFSIGLAGVACLWIGRAGAWWYHG